VLSDQLLEGIECPIAVLALLSQQPGNHFHSQCRRTTKPIPHISGLLVDLASDDLSLANHDATRETVVVGMPKVSGVGLIVFRTNLLDAQFEFLVTTPTCSVPVGGVEIYFAV